MTPHTVKPHKPLNLRTALVYIFLHFFQQEASQVILHTDSSAVSDNISTSHSGHVAMVTTVDTEAAMAAIKAAAEETSLQVVSEVGGQEIVVLKN